MSLFSERPLQHLERFTQTLQPGVTRIRLRGANVGEVGVYLGYDAQRDAPFEFRLISTNEPCFARLNEFSLLPNAFM